MAILSTMVKKRTARALSFRNRRGEQVDVTSFTATTAKNHFGDVLERALSEGAVAITRHEKARAVLLSIEEFDALRGSGTKDTLDTLSGEFDAMLERMQTPEAMRAVEAAFHASPAELGRAAVRAARKRG